MMVVVLVQRLVAVAVVSARLGGRRCIEVAAGAAAVADRGAATSSARRRCRRGGSGRRCRQIVDETGDADQEQKEHKHDVEHEERVERHKLHSSSGGRGVCVRRLQFGGD